MKISGRIVTIALPVVFIMIAFAQNPWLGFAAIALAIGFWIYRGRASLHMLTGISSYNKGDRERAFFHLQKAYEINPENRKVAPIFGYCLLKSGEIGKAEDVLTSFLQTGPEERSKLDAQMNLALIRWKQNRLPEAVEMLENVQNKIRTTVLYGSLGYLYLAKGDLDRALQYNLEAYEYNATDPVILDNLVLTHIRRGEWEQAEGMCRLLAALSPKFPEAYYHEGLILLHKGNKQAALEKFDEALRRPFTAVSTESREAIAAAWREIAQSSGIPDSD